MRQSLTDFQFMAFFIVESIINVGKWMKTIQEGGESPVNRAGDN